ncbi:MobF family relaxase [Streptomyces flavidovirens]
MRGVAFGDGRRPARQPMKDAQEKAGLPPGVWMGRGLAALGLTAGETVTERQMELLFGMGRHSGADRRERELLDDGADLETARLATVLGQPIEEIEARKQTPLLALDFVFRPQASLIVLWALGDKKTRRVIERAHERAIAVTLGWLEDEVAETRWSSGRKRAKAPALVVAKWRHFDNRDGFPLLHNHCLIANGVQSPDVSWYALDTVRLLQHVVAAGTLYTLTMTTEVCEKVSQELIDWSYTRLRRSTRCWSASPTSTPRSTGGCPTNAPATDSAGGQRRTPAGRRRPPSRWSSCSRGGAPPRSCASGRRWSTGC